MTQAVAKYAARKLLSKEMNKYKSKDPVKYDPYYEIIPHPRNPDKTKKVKKQIPDYIPPADAEILAWCRRRAYKLDVCLFSFMGVRFGWSSVIGIIPAAGDAIDTALALQLVNKARKISCGLPSWTLLMMLCYVVFDMFIGVVPFVGDLLDAGVKANTWNVRLLEKRLDEKYRPDELKKQDQRLKDRKEHVPPPATAYESFSDEEFSSRENSPVGYDRRNNTIPAPKPARIPDARRGEAPPQMSSHGRGLGLFGGGRREREPDLETGIIREGRNDRNRDARQNSRR